MLTLQKSNLPSVAVNDNGIDVERDGQIVPAMVPFADMLYASDVEWWRNNAQQALKFPGLKVSCSETEFKSIMHLKQTGDSGFDPDPSSIRHGSNSGYAALHIAIQAKAKRILLLGFDMSNSNGHHWFGKHRAGLRTTDPHSFVTWAKAFSGLIGHGSEIINCTPGSALTCFPMMDLEQALQ